MRDEPLKVGWNGSENHRLAIAEPFGSEILQNFTAGFEDLYTQSLTSK